jgi:hypothetical protein
MKQEKFNELIAMSPVKLDRSRRKEVIHAKSAIINVMRRYYSTTTVELAQMLDIHHSTVIHHTDDHASRYRFESAYADLYDRMVRHIIKTDGIVDSKSMIELIRENLAVK